MIAIVDILRREPDVGFLNTDGSLSKTCQDSLRLSETLTNLTKLYILNRQDQSKTRDYIKKYLGQEPDPYGGDGFARFVLSHPKHVDIMIEVSRDPEGNGGGFLFISDVPEGVK
jgi:hypothetical protein